VGTRKKHDGIGVPPCIKRLVMRTDVRKLLKAVASCDVVVYDLHDADMEELELVLRALHSSEITHHMTFILVSSVGVWSRTQRTYEDLEVLPEAAVSGGGEEAAADGAADGEAPVGDADGGGEATPAAGLEATAPARRPVPLTSQDYTRRIPAPKFQEWKTLETTVLALREKGTVRPYVVCAGLPYGNGEDCFLSLFKAAWMSKDTLRYIGDGNNFIPCVHARDCARLVRRIVETKPELEYHLAVDSGDVTQKEIVQAVASEFNIGYDLQSVSVPEALLAELADVLTMDLRLEPSPIMEPSKPEEPDVVDESAEADAGPAAMLSEAPSDAEAVLATTIKPPVNFRWWCEKGIAANITTVVKEFIRWRQLKPLRVLILGPPGSGAGKLVAMLAERYGVEAANMDNVLENVRNLETPLGVSLRDMLAQIEAAVSNPKATGPFHVPSALMTQILDETVLQKASSQFRGFVLSGFPSTTEEAVEFFLEDPPADPAGQTADPAGDHHDKGHVEKIFKVSVAPDAVVVLSSSEERCQQRSLERKVPMPEKEFATKMARWKEAFPEEGAKLTDIFIDRGITPLTLEVDDVGEDELCDQIAANFLASRRVVNFRPVLPKQGADSKEQAAEAAPVHDEGSVQKEAEGKRRKKEDEDRLEAIKKEELVRLEKHSETLRQYLMQFVVPTLTTGLIDMCRETPEDPVAYLAEYLSSYSAQSNAARRGRPRQRRMSSSPTSG